MSKESFVTGRYEDRGGCRGYADEEEVNPCPFMTTFETRIPYLTPNMNYDVTRLSKDWRPDQITPDLLAPKMKSRNRLLARDRPDYVNTLTPRPTLALCSQFGYLPGCEESDRINVAAMYEGMANRPSRQHSEEDSDFNLTVVMRPDTYEMPGVSYDPAGYDDCNLNYRQSNSQYA
jgi:hypothetical protein